MYDLATDCRICGSDNRVDVLDLGSQPPANHIRRPNDPAPAPVPLHLFQCGSCRTAQITATLLPEELFSSYLWVTGTSAVARSYCETFVDRVDSVLHGLDRPVDTKPAFVVEVASNDGTFLRPFLERNWRALGVEPARNIAEVAAANGVPTVSEFFCAEVAEKLLREHGCADVVVARNVIPHVAKVHSVIEGLAIVAGERGVVVIEAHCAEVIIDQLHYDSIYHEHLFYFSLETLCGLCERHGLYPFDVFESPISGGSLAVFFSPHRYSPSSRLDEASERGQRLDTNSHGRWAAFANSSIEHAAALKEVVAKYSRSGNVVGYGASARSSTMLNFAGITNLDLAAVIDQNELKQGRLTAGTDIPIVSPEVGLGEIGSSDTVLLLAWNFEKEIVGRLRSSGFLGDIIVPLPRKVRVL